MTQYLLGIDAGGTKTCALLADGQGHILGRGLSGPGNIHSVGRKAAQKAVLAAVQAAFTSAKMLQQPVAAMCIGAAGAGQRSETEAWEQWCREQRLAHRTLATNDAELVLAAALQDQEGIVVIGGTGSIAFAQSQNQERKRAGGWGYIIGDKGSAYDITCQALNAVLKEFDGRLPHTELTPVLLKACACQWPPDLIGYVYSSGVDRHQLSRLAVMVDRVAEKGDAVAGEILDHAGEELAELAIAAGHVAKLEGKVRCGVAGGVLIHSQRVRERFVTRLASRGLIAQPLILVSEPAQGAVHLASPLASGKP